MQKNGIIVDTKAIANGLYRIITEKGEESLVAFGMIPLWIIELAEKMIREKIIEIKAAQMQVTPDELRPHVDKAALDAIVAPIIRQISTDIYGAAKDAGMMIV